MSIELPADPVPADRPPQPLAAITVYLFRDKNVAATAKVTGPVSQDDLVRACGWAAVLLCDQMKAASQPQIQVANGWQPPPPN